MINIITLVSFLFTNLCHAYNRPIKHLLDKKYNEAISSSYLIIKNSSSKEEIKAVLSLLDQHSSELYESSKFAAEVVPYNNGICINKKTTSNVCSKAFGHEYSLSQNGLKQTISIETTKLKYLTSKRTKNQSSRVSFGKALHLIKPPSHLSTKYYYLLAREIETSAKNDILKQTINLFRVEYLNSNQTCKLAELDVTHGEEDYKLMTTFAKLLAPMQKCEQKFIIF